MNKMNAIRKADQGNPLKKLPLILASGSPRRREILEQIGIEFIVCVSDVKEVITKTNPDQVVLELAEQKGEFVAKQFKEGIILSADTIVSAKGQILGKPQGKEEAYEMLQCLSGQTHSVYTGVCILRKEKGQITGKKLFFEETKVEMYPLTEQEIQNYIEDGEPLDKAGAYGIQGKAAIFVKAIQGDYYNVVGLPVARVYQELKNF